MIKKNHRRKGEKRTEHAPSWEGSTEGQHGVAKGRRRYKRNLARKDRRREAREAASYLMLLPWCPTCLGQHIRETLVCPHRPSPPRREGV